MTNFSPPPPPQKKEHIIVGSHHKLYLSLKTETAIRVKILLSVSIRSQRMYLFCGQSNRLQIIYFAIMLLLIILFYVVMTIMD